MPDLSFLKDRLNRFLNSNSSAKKLIVLNMHEGMDALAGLLDGLVKNADKGLSVLVFKSAIPKSFGFMKDFVKIPSDYLTSEDYSKIDDYVFNDISKRWDEKAKIHHRDIFAHRNIELGRIAEYDLQLYLLIRVKALAVLSKAIRRDRYEAVLIIDANDELKGIDSFVSASFSVKAALVVISKNPPIVDKAKRLLASSLSRVIDSFVPVFIKKKKRSKLIDARLLSTLDIREKEGYIPTFFEEGLTLRVRSVFKGQGYISLRISPSQSPELAHPPREMDDYTTEVISKAFSFEGLSYWSVVKDRILALVSIDFRRFRRNIDLLNKAYERYGIRSAIFRNDLKEAEKTAVLTCREKGLYTVVVQHGILAEFNGHDRIYADRLAAWGGHSVDWYKRFGNDPEKIVVTGNPHFDRLLSISNSPADSGFFKSLNLRMRKFLAVLISPGQSLFRQTAYVFDDVAEVMIKSVVSAAKELGDVDLVIKLHPNEDIRSFSKFLNEDDKRFAAMVDKIDLARLIKAADLVITMDSTVGLEAVVLGKPVMVTNFTGRRDLIPFVDRNVAVGTYKIDDVSLVMRKALNDEAARTMMERSRDGFINYFLSDLDGKAKERVARFIEGL